MDRRVDLWCLPDPPPGERPSQPLGILIKLAIYGSAHQKLTLREIYAALEERFEWFRNNTEDSAWKVRSFRICEKYLADHLSSFY